MTDIHSLRQRRAALSLLCGPVSVLRGGNTDLMRRACGTYPWPSAVPSLASTASTAAPDCRRNIAFSGRIPLPRRVAEWSTNSGTPSLDQQGLACAIYALALFGQLGGRERSHTCHPNATFTTRRRSLVNESTACPRLPSTTTGERRTSMSTAHRVHISTMKRPFW